MKISSFKKMIIISVVAVFCFLGTKNHLVQAITFKEQIKFGQTYKGIFKSNSTDDSMGVYKVKVPSNGNVTLSIKNKAKISWNGHIENSKGDVLLNLKTDSKAQVSGNSEKTVPLKKGDYFIVMQKQTHTFGHQYELKASIKTSPLTTSVVSVVNNKGKNDTVTVKNIAKNDIVKVYNASKSGKNLASKKSTGSTVSLAIKQLGGKSGKVYVTVTRSGLAESNRVAVSYKGEQSNVLTVGQMKVVNNKGKTDLVSVSKIAKGDTVKIYSAIKGGKLLASKQSTGPAVSVSIKQLGTKPGKVYVTVIRSGMTESNRVTVGYKGEVAPVSPKVVVYANCTELNKVYKGGVARNASVKNKGGKTRYEPFVSQAIYDANKKSDRDKDLIACER